MRYGEFLAPGGCIGFVAPSFGCATEPYQTAFHAALDKFSTLGYGTKLGPNCYAAEGIGISNTPEKCARELNDAFADEDVDVILSCGGGELMCEILPYVDFDRIAGGKPKWYMGYSDNTNYTFLSATIADTAAIYGPCAPTFGMSHWHRSLTDAMDLLCGKRVESAGYEGWEKESKKDEEHPLEPYNITEQEKYFYFLPGMDRAAEGGEASPEGRLLGGCLDCLANLVGTEFDHVREFQDRYREDGVLWFLEACDLNPMSLRRSLWEMKHAGWFRNARGFLIGRSLHFGEEAMGLDMISAYTGILGDLHLPMVLDLDIGHLSPQMPLITGAYARTEAVGNRIKVRYDLR